MPQLVHHGKADAIGVRPFLVGVFPEKGGGGVENQEFSGIRGNSSAFYQRVKGF
jgi:hypothetical protein